MSRVDELNHTAQLKRVGFGQPPPRHGLHLLHWFCKECLYFDENNKMVPLCNPNLGEFGFHPYVNRFDQLLPDINFPYFVVGNLNHERADQLPDDIRQAYTGHCDSSNKDRIIVSLKNGSFDTVYITEHRDEKKYNPKKTYCINKKLIKYINNKDREDFLNEMGIASTVSVPQNHEARIEINDSAEQEPPRSRGWLDYCTIL